MTSNITALTALISDFCGAYECPVGSTLGFGIQKMFEERTRRARDLLIESIKEGEKDISDAGEIDEVVPILYRYVRAANEGTAKANLRILAMIIVGQAYQKALRADEFLAHADVLSSLRHEELVTLGSICRHLKNRKDDSLEEITVAMNNVKAELVGSFFKTEAEFNSAKASLLRTGYLSPSSSLAELYFEFTPFLKRLCELASIEEALAKEAS